MAKAAQTYYLNADKSKALPAKSQPAKMGEGEVFDETPDGAAFLLARKGGEISDEDVEKYGVKVADETAAEDASEVDSAPQVDAAEAAPKKAAKKATKKGK